MEDTRFAIRVLIVLVAVVLAGAAFKTLPLLQATYLSGEQRVVQPRGALSAQEESTIALFEQARGSVVFIATAGRRVNPFTRNVTRVPRGTGSGFVWDAFGHVVTNAHVLEGASSATVRLADGRSFSAALVGTDLRNDLAVLRIGVGDDRPPPVPLGTSADLKVGQSVFAIGNPFGLDWTLTTGIVSALEREIARDPGAGGGFIGGLIQTDAAINPGNSGGPLLDSAGRLIGVNTAIYSPSGSNAGIGFAVPVDTVNRVVPRLIANGEYRPPALGISVDPQAQALARASGIDGVLVLGVAEGSPAAAAGLAPASLDARGRLVPGDVIVAIDGEAVRGLDDLDTILERHDPGDRVTLSLRRDGQVRDVSIALAAAS